MASVGTRHRTDVSMGNGFVLSEMAPLASEFANVSRNILNESGIDIFQNPTTVLHQQSSREALRDLFVNESADPAEFGGNMQAFQEHNNDMGELFENDCTALLEYAPMTQFNPVIGMTFPIHKNILMNNIFDKGAIPKFVAREPKFTLTMETRLLVTPDGQEIDMFLEQNKMYAAIESTAPMQDVILDLPEAMTTDVLSKVNGTGMENDHDSNLSIESAVSAVLVKSYVLPGETYFDPEADGGKGQEKVATEAGEKDIWVKIPPANFTPYYGEYDRILMQPVRVKARKLDVDGKTVVNVLVEGTMSGYTQKNKFLIQCSNPAITKIKLSVRMDTSSAMLRTCSVKWKTNTQIVEIPNAIPINVPVSPEEVKDIGALYQVNQLTKIMSMFKLTLANYKDDKIHKFLDESFIRMPEANKLAKTFDFAPREGYYSDHIEWRSKTFMDALDTHVTNLLQVLNDPNMTITVIGNADLIRKITPTEYTYQSPSNIGPVALDYQKTVVTSDKRVYNFISSDKLRDNKNLIVLLCPRNTERIVYRLYDYQLYVSNEIRNAVNYALPAIHAFERFKMVEYQPVQARIKILNPTGLRDYVPNDDPIGVNLMNNYTMNFPEGSQYIPKEVPAKVDHVNPNTQQPGL